MWAHYADSHDGKQKGVVFGLAINDANHNSIIQLKSSSDLEIRHVRYTNTHPVYINEKLITELIILRNKYPDYNDEEFLKWLNHNLVFHSIYTKSLDWAYEKEYRCIKHLEHLENKQYYMHENLSKNQFSEIILGKDIDLEDEKLILKLVQDNKLRKR